MEQHTGSSQHHTDNATVDQRVRHRGATFATSRACVRLVHARRLLPTRAQRASVVSGTHTRRFAWWCDRVRMEWSMSERMRIESQMRGFCVMHG